MSGLLEFLTTQGLGAQAPPRNELAHVFSSEREIGTIDWRDRRVTIGLTVDGFHCERLKLGNVMTMVTAAFTRSPKDRSLSSAEMQQELNRDFMALIDERLRLNVVGLVAFQSSAVARMAIALEEQLLAEVTAFTERFTLDVLPAAVGEEESPIALEGASDVGQN